MTEKEDINVLMMLSAENILHAAQAGVVGTMKHAEQQADINPREMILVVLHGSSPIAQGMKNPKTGKAPEKDDVNVVLVTRASVVTAMKRHCPDILPTLDKACACGYKLTAVVTSVYGAQVFCPKCDRRAASVGPREALEA